MAESDESVAPSTMNLRDMLEMATSPNPEDQVPTPNTSKNNLKLTDAKASTTVPAPSSGLSYELHINYNDSLAKRIEALANSAQLSDVTLIVGVEKTKIKAHKLILALSSPVFTSMFYGSLPSRDVIEIPDCRSDVFLSFIQYLYGEHKAASRLPVSKDSVPFILGVLYIARKYAVKALEDICAVTLSSELNAGNVFDILNASDLHSMPVLDAECWEYIEEHTEAVLEQHVQNMDVDVFSLILKNEHLNIKEVRLFQFVMRWIENECEEQKLSCTEENKLNVGKKLLSLIRFPTMTSAELADIVIPASVLTVEQIAKIFIYINASSPNKSSDGMEYSDKKREPKGRFHQNHVSLSMGSAFVLFEAEQRDTEATNTTASVAFDMENDLRTRSRRSRRSRRRNSNRSSFV